MKLIAFKTAEMESGAPFDYKNVLIATLKQHPQGMGIEEMEKVLRIVGILKSANGKCALEDADYDYVVKRMSETQWMVADPAIVEFIKDLRAAPVYDVNAALKEM